MTISIRARPLTRQELEEDSFLKSDVGQQVVALGRPMSIMGNADNHYVNALNIDMKWRREYLGGGDYIYDGPPRPAATGGRTVSVLWSSDLVYVHNAANGLQIPVFFDSNVLYFESKFENAFLDAFSYADHALHEMDKNTFFPLRIFGFGVPNWNSKGSKAIQEDVRNILAKAKNK